MLERAKRNGVALELPLDHVVAPKLEATAPAQTLDVGDPSIGDRMGLDIGPKTVAHYADIIRRAKTVVWNGPMGVFEMPPFAAGTIGVARAVAAVPGTTIIGGGDSVAAVTQAGVADSMTHISTGGGASLEFLGGRTLPGVDALKAKQPKDRPPCASPCSPRTGRCTRPCRKPIALRARAQRARQESHAAWRSSSRRRSPRWRRPRKPRATRRVDIAAQDLYFEREGAFTGEVSAA